MKMRSGVGITGKQGVWGDNKGREGQEGKDDNRCNIHIRTHSRCSPSAPNLDTARALTAKVDSSKSALGLGDAIKR
jgi:hypothetical protein